MNQTGRTSVGRRRQASKKRLLMGGTRMRFSILSSHRKTRNSFRFVWSSPLFPVDERRLGPGFAVQSPGAITETANMPRGISVRGSMMWLYVLPPLQRISPDVPEVDIDCSSERFGMGVTGVSRVRYRHSPSSRFLRWTANSVHLLLSTRNKPLVMLFFQDISHAVHSVTFPMPPGQFLLPRCRIGSFSSALSRCMCRFPTQLNAVLISARCGILPLSL